MTEPRTCAKPGCNRPIPGTQLACQGHWFSLSPDLRSRITDAFRRKQAGGSPLYYRQCLVVAFHEWKDKSA